MQKPKAKQRNGTKALEELFVINVSSAELVGFQDEVQTMHVGGPFQNDHEAREFIEEDAAKYDAGDNNLYKIVRVVSSIKASTRVVVAHLEEEK